MLDQIEQFAVTDLNINEGSCEFNADNYGGYFTKSTMLLLMPMHFSSDKLAAFI